MKRSSQTRTVVNRGALLVSLATLAVARFGAQEVPARGSSVVIDARITRLIEDKQYAQAIPVLKQSLARPALPPMEKQEGKKLLANLYWLQGNPALALEQNLSILKFPARAVVDSEVTGGKVFAKALWLSIQLGRAKDTEYLFNWAQRNIRKEVLSSRVEDANLSAMKPNVRAIIVAGRIFSSLGHLTARDYFYQAALAKAKDPDDIKYEFGMKLRSTKEFIRSRSLLAAVGKRKDREQESFRQEAMRTNSVSDRKPALVAAESRAANQKYYAKFVSKLESGF